MINTKSRLFKKYETGKTSIRTYYEDILLEVSLCEKEKLEENILKLEDFVLNKEHLVWIKRVEKEQYESYLKTCHDMQILSCVTSLKDFMEKQKLQRIYMDVNGNISISFKDLTEVLMGWGIQCFPVVVCEKEI